MSVAFASILEGAIDHSFSKSHLGTRVKAGNGEVGYLKLFMQAALNGWACPHTQVKEIGDRVQLLETTNPEVLSKVFAGSANTIGRDERTLVHYRGEHHVAIPAKQTYDVRVGRLVAILYTRERYMEDPQTTVGDVQDMGDAEHVVVALQALPEGHPEGPAPLSATRLQANMAGGNPAFFKTEEELEAMSAEEARAHIKMLQSAAADGKAYQERWCVVGW